MTAAANDLTTLTNALAWLGCQSDDAFGTLQRVITAVSTAMPCLASRNCVLLSHAAALSATTSTELAYAFRMKASFGDDAEGVASTPRDDPPLLDE